jgi:Uma2 family endonuclease
LGVAAATPYPRLTLVPADAVRWPIVFPALPQGFVPEDGTTWPAGPGRYEFVEGRLEYMPPCGEIQQFVAVDVIGELSAWRRANPGFSVGGNEAGMILGGDVRAADAAVWPAKKAGSGYARTAPILAVEVAGAEDTLDLLEKKAVWYFSHGVEVVWIVLPETRSVRVATKAGHVDIVGSGKIPEHPSLPGLTPDVSAFFQQL